MRTLILGTIDNYRYYQLTNFLLSLSQTMFSGHVCFFVGPNISPYVRRRLVYRNIEIKSYDNPPVLTNTSRVRTLMSRLELPIHMFNFRHVLYLDYLLDNRHKFTHVLLSDVRDVFFQKDPFDFDMKKALYVAVENLLIPIGKEPYTLKWISQGYGPDVASSVMDRHVICAGTTIGPTRLMIKYLVTMYREMRTIENLFDVADQGILNAIVHTGKLTNVEKMYNFRGPVLTVGREPRYLVNHSDELVNYDGSVVKIVHQYDRHYKLERLIHHKLYWSRFVRKMQIFCEKLNAKISKLVLRINWLTRFTAR